MGLREAGRPLPVQNESSMFRGHNHGKEDILGSSLISSFDFGGETCLGQVGSEQVDSDNCHGHRRGDKTAVGLEDGRTGGRVLDTEPFGPQLVEAVPQEEREAAALGGI